MDNIKEILRERAGLVESFLASVGFAGTPDRLGKAMRYSLDAGGKRIRPVLCLSAASLCGLAMEKALPFAGAIEMIHTYSLIHDDLPAMDNDDLRRGKPSNHKAFDEATAILAGDGLLTDAFAVIARMDLPAGAVLAALGKLAVAAGSAGMVGGQMLDMQYTGKSGLGIDELAHMHALKTGAILRASCQCGAILAQGSADLVERLGEYGRAFGMAFQIVDDILDVTASTEELGKPAGSDEEEGKNTYPSLLGLGESRKIAREQAALARNSLADLAGVDADFLRALADYIIARAA